MTSSEKRMRNQGRNDVSVQIARIGGETAEQYPAEIVGGKGANLTMLRQVPRALTANAPMTHA